MAEELLGPVFEIHGGGLDLVFPHHENEIAQSRALGHEFAQVWMHNGMLRFAGEKMSKSLGNIVTMRDAIDEWGRETLLVFFLGGHWRKPIDYSDEALGRRPRRPRASATSSAASRREGGDWGAFAAALDDDFNTPEALAVMHGWRDHELLRRALEVFGLESLAEVRGGAGGARRARARRLEARARKDFETSDRLRDEIEAAGLGGARRDAEPASSSCRGGDSELVYGRRPVREALRGPRRGARALGDRAGAEGRAVAAGGRRRLHVKPERELTAEAGTQDHQGVLARVEPYRYADALRARGRRGAAAGVLDSVTDPRNLGAVIRSAEGARRRRRRRARARLGACDACGRARLGRRGRARAGRGRHEPRPLPRRDQGPAALGLGGGRRRRDARCGRPTSPAARSSCSAPRARACGRSCAAPATTRVSIPLAGKVESLNVSVAAALLLYEAQAAAPWLSRRSTCSTATTCCTPGRSRIRASSSTGSRASSRCSGARGVVVFDGVGEERDARPARGALRRERRRAARAARRRAPRPRDGLPRLVRLGRPRHVRAGGAEAQLANLPAGPRASPGTRTRADRSSEIAWTKRRENV